MRIRTASWHSAENASRNSSLARQTSIAPRNLIQIASCRGCVKTFEGRFLLISQTIPEASTVDRGAIEEVDFHAGRAPPTFSHGLGHDRTSVVASQLVQ